jgi:hypothetical protein
VSTEPYWISKTLVVDWVLENPTTGLFVPAATVAGTVTLPAGTTAAMSVSELTDRYRATYDPTTAGLHAWRLTATGAADSAEEGTVIVRRSLTGATPITVDPTTSIGLVRLLISDTTEADPVFTDTEITAFLTLESTNARLAAAVALETLASNEAMVSKVIRTNDLSTDGTKVAAELRARAALLREQATGSDTTGTAFVMDVVDWDPTDWLLVEES